MMDQNQMQSSEEPQQDQGQEPGSPIDEIIARVDSYMKDPKMVTPETLMALKNDLMDLKSVLDGDDRAGMDEAPQDSGSGPGGLSSVIGKARGQ